MSPGDPVPELPPIDPVVEAQKTIAAARQARADAFQTDLQQLLAKHRVTLAPVILVRNGGVENLSVQIIPLD